MGFHYTIMNIELLHMNLEFPIDIAVELEKKHVRYAILARTVRNV